MGASALPSSSPPLPELVGRVLGRYRLVKKLGAGGMGAVYEAVHTELGRRVAVKVLHPGGDHNPDKFTRFFNEARAAGRVEDRGVISVYEFDRTADGTAYIVMEFLAGTSLRQRFRDNWEEVLTKFLPWTRQISSALAATHAKQIVHRDLKPDNIMIVPDAEAPGGERVKLLDFGIAKLAVEGEGEGDALSVQTKTGQMLGTPVYMSPEQCRGNKTVGAPTDVYSLGVMMYEMLTGKPPFRSSGMGELMMMHMMAEPPPLAEAAPGITTQLAALVHAMLAKEPRQRPTMVEVTQKLKEIPDTGVRVKLRRSAEDSDDSMSSMSVAAPSSAESVEPSDGKQSDVLAAGAVSRKELQTTHTAQPRRKRAPMIAASFGIAAIAAMVLLQGLRGGGIAKNPAATDKQSPNQMAKDAIPIASAATTEGSKTSVTPNSPGPAPTPPAAIVDTSESASIERSAQNALDGGNPKQAIRLLRSLSALRPKRPATFAVLCRAYEALGQSQKAVSACRAAGIPAKGMTPTASPESVEKTIEPATPNRTSKTEMEPQVDYLR